MQSEPISGDGRRNTFWEHVSPHHLALINHDQVGVVNYIPHAYGDDGKQRELENAHEILPRA